MTSILCWVGVDQRGPASVYIASDSRIRWPAGHYWDHGRKTYASTNHPVIFGYSGDVLFPSLVLPTVLELLALGTLSPARDGGFSQINKFIRRAWLAYPNQESRNFSIFMVARAEEKMKARFLFEVMSFRAATNTWSRQVVKMPARSAILELSGSGRRQIETCAARWQQSAHANTSRAVFSAFCDALREATDPWSGGGPQLVGLRRIGPGRNFGVVFAGARRAAGATLTKSEAGASDLEWFNEMFERVDPSTGGAPGVASSLFSHRKRESHP